MAPNSPSNDSTLSSSSQPKERGSISTAPARDDKSMQLLNRVRDKDPQAAMELFDRYVQRLVALVRVRLSPKLKRRIDPEDVVQSAYRSFFMHAQTGQFSLQRS